ncbi:hypothetical protein CU100_25620 [Phyllobacterium endophyticum]|uniref:Uncharacterized protein n=1 Tax=Phyllobacterium endophyticum TaxID=1149773 RepID=A0A2P7AK30_9HYPH|nr:hypothetical protein CU100_25620 [Phyllobacterium endophyticum]
MTSTRRKAENEVHNDADSVIREQLENYLYLATCYTGLERRALDAFASELLALAGLCLAPHYNQAGAFLLVDDQTNIKP